MSSAAAQVDAKLRALAARVAVILSSLSVFAGCYWLFSQSNDFPAEYHPDEPGKALQVQQGRRNYRHPQLLLELSTVVTHWSGSHQPLAREVGANTATPAERAAIQRAVRMGRSVSAALAAGAVLLFSLAAFLTAGRPAMVLVGASLAVCQPLLINAHFMKEDTALVFGLSVLAMVMAWTSKLQGAGSPSADRSVRLRAASLLGIAFCLAGSGKYVGVLTIIPALWMLFALRTTEIEQQAATEMDWVLKPLTRRRLLAQFFLAATLTSFVVNWRVFKNPGTWAEAVGNQIVDGVVEHAGLTMSRPNSFFIRAFIDQTPVWVLVIAGITTTYSVALSLLVFLARYRYRPSVPLPANWRWGLMWLAAPLPWLCIISFSTAPNHRHVLPAVLLAHFSAAAILGMLIETGMKSAWPRGCLVVVLAGLILATGLPAARDISRQFAVDTRYDAHLAYRTLPSSAVVLQDAAASLHVDITDRYMCIKPAPSNPPARLITRDFAPELGDWAELRRQGVTHVVVCDLSYGRYFTPQVHPIPEFQVDYERRRSWYQRLFSECQLVEAFRPAVPTHAPASPEIRIYRIPN